MRASHCLVGACLAAAGSALPLDAACKAVRPVTTTLVVWVTAPAPTSSASIEAGTPEGVNTQESPAASSASTTVPVPASSAAVSSTSSLPTSSIASTSSTSSTSSTTTSITPESPSETASTESRTSPTAASSAEPSTTSAAASSAEPSTTSAASSAPSPEAPSPSSSTSAPVVAPTATPAPITTRAYPADVVDKLRDSSFSKLQQFSANNVAGSGCTLENAAVRYEWSDLSIAQRQEWIASVKCLMEKPSKLGASVPGARSRYDDFVAVHIQQTPTIHGTPNFLSWHRYYTWAFEQALRNECGYSGYQPYWNWDRYANDPENSPLFNGNASSISGNSPRPGACVDSGPFADQKVNLGPGNSLGYNPRCLKRAISRSNAQQTKADKTYALITQSNNIASFQDTMQNPSGVHAMGHFTVGGDPGGDIYTSPGDVYFWIHHAMIDRVWWIWQMQDLGTRLKSVGGNVNGRPGSLEDNVNLGAVAGDVKLGSLLNTIGGKGGDFCYIYM